MLRSYLCCVIHEDVIFPHCFMSLDMGISTRPPSPRTQSLPISFSPPSSTSPPPLLPGFDFREESFCLRTHSKNLHIFGKFKINYAIHVILLSIIFLRTLFFLCFSSFSKLRFVTFKTRINLLSKIGPAFKNVRHQPLNWRQFLHLLRYCFCFSFYLSPKNHVCYFLEL